MKEKQQGNWWERWLGGQKTRGRARLAETENTLLVGTGRLESSDRDRNSPDRAEVLESALEAWRVNPLARRIVGLTSQYVVGGGVTVSCKHAATGRFVEAFWNHRLNHLPVRLVEFCDELTRAGNLFVLVSTDAAGMSYLRAVPASNLAEITPRPNDVEQALAYRLKPTLAQPDPPPYPAYDEASDAQGADGSYSPVMLHYAVNRPVGAAWGEPDLAPLLRWLARYANWLEDRARLNRFRNAFLYIVRSRFSSEAERAARQAVLNANPPAPGSILVADESESWEVIHPRLESSEAGTDGLALKKMIAAGAGLPLHFLAEPESATRTTAESAGGQTYRWFEQRQNYFLWVVADILRVVINRRALVDRSVSRRAVVEVHGADISARDNLELSQAAANVLGVVESLRDRGLIDEAEALRLVYRFAGEAVDVAELLRRAGKEAGVEQ